MDLIRLATIILLCQLGLCVILVGLGVLLILAASTALDGIEALRARRNKTRQPDECQKGGT